MPLLWIQWRTEPKRTNLQWSNYTMPKNTRKQNFEKDETDFPGINKENRLDQEESEETEDAAKTSAIRNPGDRR